MCACVCRCVVTVCNNSLCSRDSDLKYRWALRFYNKCLQKIPQQDSSLGWTHTHTHARFMRSPTVSQSHSETKWKHQL